MEGSSDRAEAQGHDVPDALQEITEALDAAHESLVNDLKNRGLPTRARSTRALRHLLRTRRREMGMDQASLARAAGVSSLFVSIAETTSRRFVAAAPLVKVLRVLHVADLPSEPEDEDLEIRWSHPEPSFTMPRYLTRALQHARTTTYLTLAQVARETGLPYSSVTRVLRNMKASVPSKDVAAIASVLEIDCLSHTGRMLRAHGFVWLGEEEQEDGNLESRFEPSQLTKHIDEFWKSAGLGERPDLVIAEEYQIPVATVWRARKARGIPVFKGPKKLPAPTVERLTKALVEKLGAPPRDEEGKLDWGTVPFGQVPDTVLARWLGVSNKTVQKHRRRFGIAACPRGSLIDWSRLPLGKIPDTHVAAMTGLTASDVCSARASLGIRVAPVAERSGALPGALPPAEFLLSVTPVRHEVPKGSEARTPKAAHLWDRAAEALRIVEGHDEIEVDELLRLCNVKLGKTTRREAAIFLGDLGWSEAGDSWLRRRGSRGRTDRKDSSSVLTDVDILHELRTGLWTASELAGKLGVTTSTVTVCLSRLAGEGLVRQYPARPSTLYFLNPEPPKKKGKSS